MLNGSKGSSRLAWVLVGALSLASSAAQAQTYLYWTDRGVNNRIGRVNLATPGAPEINFITGCNSPQSVSVNGGYIYWTNYGSSTIGRALLDGTSVNHSFVTIATSPAVHLTVTGGYIYYTKSYFGCIGRVAIATPGSPDDPWIGTSGDGTRKPWGIAADSTNVYWTDQFLKAVLWAPLATGTVSTTVSLNANARGLGLAVNSANVFFADADDASTVTVGPNIGKVALPGGGLSEHFLTVNYPSSPFTQAFPLCVAATDKLYFTDFNNNAIWQANLDGSSPTVLLDQTALGGIQANPNGICVTGAVNVISLASFTANPGASSVTLNWTTGSEIDNAGFHVWRSSDPDQGFVKVTSQLIPSTSVFSSGASYSWTDATATPGRTWFYKLEDIDTRNLSTLHGPISAHVGPSAIQSFQAVPSTIFSGGTVNLQWAAANGASLSIRGIGEVSGSSLQVRPADTTSYLLTNDAGDQSLTTVTVRGFLPADMPGLSKAWGSKLGDAAYNPAYDMDGNGKVDDLDAALLLKR